MSTADPSLLPDFLTEAGELLDRLGEDVFALAEDASAERLNAVFRGFHTIKGGAGFLELAPVVTLCHRAEDAFGRVRDGQLAVTPALVDAALDAVKVLDQQVALLHDGGMPLETPAAVLSAFDALLGTAADDAISEDEFEALLDQLHGTGAAPAGPPPAAPARVVEVSAPAPVAARTPDTTVRVDSERIDHLMTLVGELVIVRNRLKADPRLRGPSGGLMGELDRVTVRLQNAVMRVRMQPVGRLFARFPRVVRDLARELGKQVRVELAGEDTDLDKHLVDALADPLIHLVRNAVDHGIESPEVRRELGKNPVGRLLLSASQRGDSVMLRVEDDGKGLDPDAIRASAVRKGLLDERAAAALTPAQACELVLRPGFSTREAVSSVSGRGVGMDVVASAVRALGGRLSLSGQVGRGAVVELVLPLTLAILPTLRTRCGPRSLALPLRQVMDLQPFDPEALQWRAGQPVLPLQGRSVPVTFLDQWLDLPAGARSLLVRVTTHHGERGLVVDGVEGREDVVLKPPGRLLRGIPGYGGAAVTGDGRIALILDPDGLTAAQPET